MLVDELDYVVGVDPHRDTHALAVVEVRSGAVVFEASTLADAEGYVCLLRLADQHAPGRRAFAVEGTGSFGAGLTRFLRSSNKMSCEATGSRRSPTCARSVASSDGAASRRRSAADVATVVELEVRNEASCSRASRRTALAIRGVAGGRAVPLAPARGWPPTR